MFCFELTWMVWHPGKSSLQYSPYSEDLNVICSLPLILISAPGTTVPLGFNTNPFTPKISENIYEESLSNMYKITAVLKVETDIITTIAAMSMSCDTSDNVCRDLQNWRYYFYRWRQNVFDVTLTDNFQYQSQFLRMQVTNWPNIFVDQCQFSDPDFISSTLGKCSICR